jgi:ADP-heptose:LPS heptosyltransferase
VVEIEESAALPVGARASWGDIVAWRGGVGGFGALIGVSRSYVGYDSAFQHIAAALRVPLVDVFVGAPNARFARRWRPCSRVAARVIDVGHDVVTSPTAARALLRRAMDAHRDVSLPADAQA